MCAANDRRPLADAAASAVATGAADPDCVLVSCSKLASVDDADVLECKKHVPSDAVESLLLLRSQKWPQ